MPYKTALTFTYDCGEFEAGMARPPNWPNSPVSPRAAQNRSHGKLRGIGICNCIEVPAGRSCAPEG